MKIFHCDHCDGMVFFENDQCSNCKAPLGFLSEEQQLVSLQSLADGTLSLLNTHRNSQRWQYCENHKKGVCNWLVLADDEKTLCHACELNRHIPNIERNDKLYAWSQLEFAKHRLIYSLLRMNLPIITKLEDPRNGLAFDFISSQDAVPADASTMTGHAQGQVTINAEEANNSIREKRREDMDEDYRTLIGHFRHEVGHYYWEVIIAPDEQLLAQYRTIFGDESIDYSEALELHYKNGPRQDWDQFFISAYASSHPWEDWAETWAHYLHILETVETGAAFNISVRSLEHRNFDEQIQLDIDPFTMPDLAEILNRFLPLSIASNSLNRCLGQPDFYPFVHNEAIYKKLEFIHQVTLPYRVQNTEVPQVNQQQSQ